MSGSIGTDNSINDFQSLNTASFASNYHQETIQPNNKITLDIPSSDYSRISWKARLISDNAYSDGLELVYGNSWDKTRFIYNPNFTTVQNRNMIYYQVSESVSITKDNSSAGGTLNITTVPGWGANAPFRTTGKHRLFCEFMNKQTNEVVRVGDELNSDFSATNNHPLGTFEVYQNLFVGLCADLLFIPPYGNPSWGSVVRADITPMVMGNMKNIFLASEFIVDFNYYSSIFSAYPSADYTISTNMGSPKKFKFNTYDTNANIPINLKYNHGIIYTGESWWIQHVKSAGETSQAKTIQALLDVVDYTASYDMSFNSETNDRISLPYWGRGVKGNYVKLYLYHKAKPTSPQELIYISCDSMAQGTLSSSIGFWITGTYNQITWQ